MATATIPEQVKAILFLLGIPHDYYGDIDHYKTAASSIANCDVNADNWRMVAQTLSNTGAHISYHVIEGVPPSMIFIYENEDEDPSLLLKKFPPFTFKA